MKRSRLSYDEWKCIKSKKLKGNQINTEFFKGYIGIIEIEEVSEKQIWIGWVFPGGQVEVGENVIDAVKREIMEEAGVDIEVGEVFCIASNTDKYPGYNGVKEVPTKAFLEYTGRPTYMEYITKPTFELRLKRLI